ncbi:MAG: hypothetical protein WCQ53_00315 [bacterium]
MIINYETLSFIDFSKLYTVIAVFAFIVAILLTGKFNLVKMVLSALTLVSMILVPSSTAMLVLALISIIQAWVFVRNGQHNTAYKYFFYSFLLVFMNIPVIAGDYKLILLSIFTIKALISSYNDEISDGSTFVLNTGLLAGIALNLQPIDKNIPVVSIMLILAMTLSLLRSIFDRSVKTPLYILPLFIIASSLSDSTTVLMTVIYTLLASLIYILKSNKVSFSFLCLFAIPFIDNSVMHSTVRALASSARTIETTYIYWTIGVLSIIAVLKFYEQNLVPAFKTFKYRQTGEILSAIAVSVGSGLSNYRLSFPVPLACAIPLLFLEARYSRLVTRAPLYSLYSKIERTIIKLYNYKKALAKFICIGSKHALRTAGRKATLGLVMILSWVQRTYNRSFLFVKRTKRLGIAYLSSLFDRLVVRKIRTEELLAIIFAIMILLIYLLGDK